MNGFLLINEFPQNERGKIKWLLRHAADNGIVESGVAIKYGREWRVNRDRLPDFLRKQTLATLKQR